MSSTGGASIFASTNLNQPQQQQSQGQWGGRQRNYSIDNSNQQQQSQWDGNQRYQGGAGGNFGYGGQNSNQGNMGMSWQQGQQQQYQNQQSSTNPYASTVSFNRSQGGYPSMIGGQSSSNLGGGFISGGGGGTAPSMPSMSSGTNDAAEDVKRDTPLFQVFLKDTPLLGVKRDLSKDELNSILKEIEDSLK